MRVVVELDEAVSNKPAIRAPAKPSGLDGALSTQFEQIQRKLMGLLEAQAGREDRFLSALREQQDSLVSAMERLVGQGGNSDELLEAIRKMKNQTTVSMPKELLARFDSMEAAIANGMRRSRSRTFGSNF